MKRKVTKKELLRTFETLCKGMGVKSKGFHPEDITAPIDGARYDGTKQWAMKKTERLGWQIVSGKHGCGIVYPYGDFHIKGRLSFLIMMETIIYTIGYVKWQEKQK